jgi:hypothetical protein
MSTSSVAPASCTLVAVTAAGMRAVVSRYGVDMRLRFCESGHTCPLSASPETVATFVAPSDFYRRKL